MTVAKKFAAYRALDSLREYLLIAQDNVCIEHYRRIDNDAWILSEATDRSATIELPAIQCQLALAEVYDRLTFIDN